jgi:hypothetical protein
MVAAGARATGYTAHVTPHYMGAGRILSMYGCGSPQKGEILQAHRRTGGPFVCWDIGYFSRGRKGNREYFRVCVDGLHPSIAHVEATPEEPDRFRMHGIDLRDDYREDGPIIVVGLGRKSREGLGLLNWEAQALQSARDRFPGRKIIYRPKPTMRRYFDGVVWDKVDAVTPIDVLLHGASLVICRHSNVALDACVAGIPVECEDGIAAWLYSKTTHPNRAQRLSLLNRAAWWQWRRAEMKLAWRFLHSFVGITRSSSGTDPSAIT